MASRNFAAWVTRCDADPAQPSSGNRLRHGGRVRSACATTPPYRSLAFSVISGTLTSACESGQSRFTAFAISWNFASSMPGTVACIVSAIRSITKPAPCLVRRTLACVSTLLLASPALSQANENAIVKHAAVVLEAAREAVRIVLQRAGLGADLSQSLLALAFPVHACGLFVHGELLLNQKRDEFAVVTSAVAT